MRRKLFQLCIIVQQTTQYLVVWNYSNYSSAHDFTAWAELCKDSLSVREE